VIAVIRFVLQSIDNVNDWVGRVISLSILVMFLLMLIEVIRRYCFNSPTVWGNELTQMTFGAYVVLCGGYILRWEAHTNVDILYVSLSPKVKAIIDIATAFLFFLFAVVMLFTGTSLAWESLTTLEHSQSAWNPPLYPVKILIPTGALLLLLQGLAKLIRDIMTVLGKNDNIVKEKYEKESV